MKKGIFGMLLGLVLVAVTAFNADAQMSCAKGKASGDMQGCCRMMGGMSGGGTDGCQMMGGMGHGGRGAMHGGMHDADMKMGGDHHALWKHIQHLGLDEKQQDALKALRSKTMTDMIRKKADKQIAELELQDLLEKDPVDMKAAEAQVKKAESIRAEMRIAHLRAREQVLSLLTAEQKKRLRAMMERGPRGCAMMQGQGEEQEDYGMEEEKEETPEKEEHKHH